MRPEFLFMLSIYKICCSGTLVVAADCRRWNNTEYFTSLKSDTFRILLHLWEPAELGILQNPAIFVGCGHRKNSTFLQDNSIEAFKVCTFLLSRFLLYIFQTWLYPRSFISNWVPFPGGGNILWCFFCPVKVKIMFSNQHCLNWHAHVPKQFISSKNAHWLEIVWKLIFQMGKNAECSVKL